MRTWVSVGLIVLCSCVSQLASARPPWEKDPPPNLIEDILRVEVNVLSASYDTTARVDAIPEEPGTVFSAENDFKMPESEYLISGEITLLPGERHLIRLSGLNTQRDGHAKLLRNIDYDAETYRVNEIVDSTLNLRLFGVTYGFRMISNDRMEITPTFGIQIGEYKTNAVVRSRVLREPSGDVSPVPVIGADLRYDFTPRWSIEGRVQYVKVSISDVDASLLDWRAGVNWRFNPHFVMGLGYRSFRIDAESADEGSSGIVDLKLSGPMLYLRASL
jgi:hypothetical protein